MIGRLKVVEEKIFLSKHQLRSKTIKAYKREIGNKSIRIGLSRGKLKFIVIVHLLKVHKNFRLRLKDMPPGGAGYAPPAPRQMPHQDPG
jgi:hypothetical protein